MVVLVTCSLIARDILKMGSCWVLGKMVSWRLLLEENANGVRDPRELQGLWL